VKKMDTKSASFGSNLCELSKDEVGQVSGGVIFVAPVLVKIGAWALGASFGAGIVVAVTRAFAK
jgi:hypothetical protein